MARGRCSRPSASRGSIARGARAACIDAMRKLWTDDPASAYNGEFVRFEGVRSNPKPAQGAKLPILFGGESAPALRRVAEYGAGWCGPTSRPKKARPRSSVSKNCLRPTGANAPTLSFESFPPGPITVDDLKRYRDLRGRFEVVLITLRPAARGRTSWSRTSSRSRATGSSRRHGCSSRVDTGRPCCPPVGW